MLDLRSLTLKQLALVKPHTKANTDQNCSFEDLVIFTCCSLILRPIYASRLPVEVLVCCAGRSQQRTPAQQPWQIPPTISTRNAGANEGPETNGGCECP